MNNELENQATPLHEEAIDEVIVQITSQPKRQYTKEEIEVARQNLALMNDRVFLAHFIDNKNNHVITGLADAARKIHTLPPIPQVQRTSVQNISLFDVLGRGMIGDLLGWGEAINIALEVQKGKQDGYAVRGTLTSSNVMRTGFNMGDDYSEAPDVIGINILGFIYHDLWDICCVFRAKMKDLEEVIRMQAVKNPVALSLASEVKKTVARNDVVHDTLDRAGELLQLQNYFRRREQKAAQSADERMIITAIQSKFQPEAIEIMRKTAGINDVRLAELKNQAQSN